MGDNGPKGELGPRGGRDDGRGTFLYPLLSRGFLASMPTKRLAQHNISLT